MTQIQFDGPDSLAVIEVLEVGAGVRVRTLDGALAFNVEDVLLAGDVELRPCLDFADWFFVIVLRGSRVLWLEYDLGGNEALIEAVAVRFGESREGLRVVGTASEFPRSRVWFPALMRGEPLLVFSRIGRRGLRGLVDRVLDEHEFTFTLCPRVVDRVAGADR